MNRSHSSLGLALAVALLFPASAQAQARFTDQTDYTLAAADDALPPDFRGEITYRGVYSGQATVPGRSNSRNLLGALLNFETLPMGGEYTSVIRYNGNQVSGQTTYRNTMRGRMVTPDNGSFVGTRSGVRCTYNVPGGTTYGYCGRSASRVDGKARSPDGITFTISLTAQAAQFVDYVERDRQAQLAKAEQERRAAESQRQAAAAAAALAAKPNASSALANALEAAVAQDSGAWAFNRYDAGSMRNVKVLQGGAATRIRGDYTYNGGRSGWVEANVAAGQVNCLAYWDVGSCSPVRKFVREADSTGRGSSSIDREIEISRSVRDQKWRDVGVDAEFARHQQCQGNGGC